MNRNITDQKYHPGGRFPFLCNQTTLLSIRDLACPIIQIWSYHVPKERAII